MAVRLIREDYLWGILCDYLSLSQKDIDFLSGYLPVMEAIPVDYLKQYMDIENPKFEMAIARAVIKILGDWRKENEID